MVRVVLSDRDRAEAIAEQLLIAGFSQATVTTRTGFQVVSEPLPRSAAQGLAATLTEQGFHSQILPFGDDAVQLRFGSFTSQKEADAFSQRITAAGCNARVRGGFVVYTLEFGLYPQSSANAITGMISSRAPEATVTLIAVP